MKTVVMGLQGSGKTYLVKKHFLDKEPYHLVFDPNNEYIGYRSYVPHPKSMEDYEVLSDEVKLMIKKLVLPNIWSIEKEAKTGKKKEKRLKLIVFDEADLIMPAQKPLNSMLRNLWVNCRHYQIDLIAITRRPTDLNAYIMDTADELIIFNLAGVNALKVVRSMARGADEAVKGLSFEKHQFIHMDRARRWKVEYLAKGGEFHESHS